MMSGFMSDGKWRVLTPADSVWRWASARFEGAAGFAPVFWNPELPTGTSHSLADNQIPTRSAPGFIRIGTQAQLANGIAKHHTFERLWFFAAYELLSVSRRDQWRGLYTEAQRGSCSQQDFIKRASQLEFEVMLETDEFYRDVWNSWTAKVGFESDATKWDSRLAKNYEDWISLFGEGEDAYPMRPFAGMYDQLKYQGQVNRQRDDSGESQDKLR